MNNNKTLIIRSDAMPATAEHGNRKYPFADLKEIGSFFVVTDVSKRNNITTSLRHFNNKNGTTVKVTTKKTVEGLVVKRIG